MSNAVIRVENLSKVYTLSEQPFQKGLRHTLSDAITYPIRLAQRGWRNEPTREPQEVWALKDVSFEIKKGEVLGLIGRNGAGKSTLLKILSRITPPTRGSAEIRGRIGSLLEVGTGFHADLTGRENIYLNAAILGMKRTEIQRKFEAIVEFAEISRFIDTPVKYYSSGMEMRLAFSVAAHLEPDILIIDEVLAVGDARFQKKCLGKMGEVAHEGRTVLFVSHNMTALATLCTQALRLERGSVVAMGPTSKIISEYLSADECVVDKNQFPKDKQFRLLDMSVSQPNHMGGAFTTNKALDLCIEYELMEPMIGLRIGFDLMTTDGIVVWRSFDDDLERIEEDRRPAGTYRTLCRIPENTLAAKTYIISLVAVIPHVRWITSGAVQQTVELYNQKGVGSSYADDEWRPGVILPELSWKSESLAAVR